MTAVLHAEWTKLRTLAVTGWLLLATVVLSVGLGAVIAVAVSYSEEGSGADLTKLSLTGVQLGQAIVAILAVLAVSDEYGTGMIRVTLTAMPRRWRVLAAKAALVTALVVTAGAVAVLASVELGRAILPANGFTLAHGYSLISLSHGATARAALGSVLYLALIALMSLGVATTVRDSAVSIGIVLGLLYLFPILATVVSDPTLHHLLLQIGPMTAGLAIQSTTNLHHLPIAPWAGLAVLTGWAGAALLAGVTALTLRDA